MKTENVTLVWHTQDEKPDREFADLLVRIWSDEVQRMHFYVWQWYNAPNFKFEFVEAGNPISRTSRRDAKFEWCYLTDIDERNNYKE